MHCTDSRRDYYRSQDIDKIVFDLHTSSIDDTSVSLSDDISFTVAGTLITATSVSESHLSLHIYDTSGRKVAEVSGQGSTDYDFSGAKAEYTSYSVATRQ